MTKKTGLYIQSLLYVLAGINHFLHTAIYIAIMPPWLPWHYPLVYISGICEFVLGALLIPVNTRRMAAWGIIVMLIAIFPANVQMAINYTQEHHPMTWVSYVRLPLQAVLIWWAWLYTKKTTVNASGI
jgi:uncharacterized membrane protein